MYFTARELDAMATSFARYVKGFNEDDNWHDMVEGWEQFKKDVGTERAKEIYWFWTESLPQPRPGCDPDGD